MEARILAGKSGTWVSSQAMGQRINREGIAMPITTSRRNRPRKLLAILLLSSLNHAAEADRIERISLGSDGQEGNNASHCPRLSADGRYVAFQSEASNLIPGDGNGAGDIFVRDRSNGQTERVSVATDGSEANSGSDCTPAISADGRYVAFRSRASNLVPGDTNDTWDVFVHDRETATTERISTGPEGANSPAMSTDGRYIAFSSPGPKSFPYQDLATISPPGLFVHDRQTGLTQRLADLHSISCLFWKLHPEGQCDYGMVRPGISADGRYLAFESRSPATGRLGNEGYWNIFIHDRTAGTTRLATAGFDGREANGDASLSGLSDDGRFLAFGSTATNLMPSPTQPGQYGFVRDMTTGGTEAYGGIPVLSPDGRYVAYLQNRESPSTEEIFVHDRQTGNTEPVRLGGAGGVWRYPNDDRSSSVAAFSSDNRYLAFGTNAINLVPGDLNGASDLFVYDRAAAPAPLGTADLRAELKTSANPIPIGTSAVTTAAVTNFGPDRATAATLIWSGLTYFEALQPTPTNCHQIQSDTWLCQLGELPAGKSVELAFAFQPREAGHLTLTASAIANEIDPDPTNNASTTTVAAVTPLPPGNLAISLKASAKRIKPGRKLVYSVVAVNRDKAAVSGARIVATLPGQAMLLSASKSCLYARETHSVACQTGILRRNRPRRLVIRLIPQAPGPLVNTVEIEGPIADYDPSDNRSSRTVIVK
jgi:Tol biopolymer transport system component